MSVAGQRRKERLAEKNERQRIEREEAEAKAKFQSDLSRSQELARSDIGSYFSDRGVDPTGYKSDIDRAIEEAVLGVPEGAGNVSSYFTNIAPNLYNELANALQTRALRDINALLPQDFEGYIPGTYDDALIEEILSEQRGQADKYVQNLLDRGVVTRSGFESAMGDINAQASKARALLGDLGGQVLSSGRARLGDIAQQGRQRASNLGLGEVFNPQEYKTKIDQAFGEFQGGFGNALRALIPGEGLFQTGGLAARAGAGSGAQNTKFSPNALAGIYEEDKDESRRNPLSIF
ncbi:MAG: hypothetical protein MN733_03230 [Nitrososphaera sp.]|nr:hypothetical protein [Nitrososphaera sp.]